MSHQNQLVRYLDELEWAPDKSDLAISLEVRKYPEAVGLRKVAIGLCLTRTDPGTGIEGIQPSGNPDLVFAEIAKFTFMFALVAGHRMAHSGPPEEMTEEGRAQLASLELDSDPDRIGSLAELYRSGLEEEQQLAGLTALELLEHEFRRDARSYLYLEDWAKRAEELTRDLGGKTPSEADEAGSAANDLWMEIFSVGMFAGMELYGQRQTL